MDGEMLYDKLLKKLEKEAGLTGWQDYDKASWDHFSDVEDAYTVGVADGRTLFAREILELLKEN